MQFLPCFQPIIFGTLFLEKVCLLVRSSTPSISILWFLTKATNFVHLYHLFNIQGIWHSIEVAIKEQKNVTPTEMKSFIKEASLMVFILFYFILFFFLFCSDFHIVHINHKKKLKNKKNEWSLYDVYFFILFLLFHFILFILFF